MAAAYDVKAHNAYSVTLKKVGLRLGPNAVTIQRSQITSVRQKFGELVVDTTDGRAYRVKTGISRGQRELVKAAFGL